MTQEDASRLDTESCTVTLRKFSSDDLTEEVERVTLVYEAGKLVSEERWIKEDGDGTA